ncbi:MULTISPECIES: IS110 family transposase [unclassified Mesorhizobium]|uniref:IS110 family transposase n=1 Tax=unclassified Mesorhizobium TaxID=325217 RepID=UPI0019259C8C|nr:MULTISPECIES: IS110 family transposase [unclassified Mesorhizobium]
MDIHRTFAEVVVWEDGRLRHHGRVDMTRSGLEGFGRSLRRTDEVVVEATGNAMAVVRVLSPYVGRVIVANPMQVKAIAHARIKTDRIDAGVLAQLHASGFLPEVWVPDERTERLRRLVARRNQVVRHRTRVKNEVHGILQAHLVPKCPHADLFNRRGRAWLEQQVLPDDERAAIARHIREIDRLAEDLADLDRDIAREAVDDVQVRRLQTITGVNAIVASGIIAAVGDIRRFREPQRLVSYFGLNPRVRQSGLGLAQYGRISKHGRSHARAFFLRIRNKRGHQVAAVAVARKLAVLIWHLLTKEQDYFWARPALVAAKQRQLALKAGAPGERGVGRRGSAYAYNVKELRNSEKAAAENAERAYELIVRHWRPRGPKRRTDATKEERL